MYVCAGMCQNSACKPALYVKEGKYFVWELCVQMHVNRFTEVTFSYYYALFYFHIKYLGLKKWKMLVG